jgi:chromosomal replication initiator protein
MYLFGCEVQKIVCEYFDVPTEKLRESTRKRNVVLARQVSMFLAKQYTNNSLKAIGKHFGNRDHSTVIHSCQAVQNQMDTDQLFSNQVKDLQKKIELSIT